MMIVAPELLADVEGKVESWRECFDIRDPAGFERIVDLVAAVRGDIYTARLNHTQHVFKSVASGRLRLFVREGMARTFAGTLDLMCVAVTFDRIARTGIARLKPSGFWVRRQDGSRAPVMAAARIGKVCGMTGEALMTAFTPLLRDGVLHVVEDGFGRQGICVAAGVSDESAVRRYLTA